ncbi:MAG: hypothetical protein Q7T79_03305 [bacterium]|nr:hypothetical protein [bacterium]
MKENKKSFAELTKSLQPIEENQEGMLKGGFASITASVNRDIIINAGACANTNCQSCNTAGCYMCYAI